MSKIGLSVRVDVLKIEKERLYKGKKGTYLDLTTFVDLENKDQYDNNGFISQSVSKEEREQGIQTPILGNCKVFYHDTQSAHHEQKADGDRNGTGNGYVPPESGGANDYDDDIPF